MEASNRRDVSVAADRVIEAIRMYAAQNGGKSAASAVRNHRRARAGAPEVRNPFPVQARRRQGDFGGPPDDRAARTHARAVTIIFEITIAHDRQ